MQCRRAVLSIQAIRLPFKGDVLTGASHEDLLGAHHDNRLAIEQFLSYNGGQATEEVALTIDDYLLLEHLREGKATIGLVGNVR